MSGLRSSRNLLEAPMVIRMVLAVQNYLQMNNMIILEHFGLNSRNLLESPMMIWAGNPECL